MLDLQNAQEIIEKELKKLNIPDTPASLYEPVKYILSNGGKRIRPSIVLLTANLFSDDISDAINPALGIEVFHNFTLLHDDLMDNSLKRRGNETVHIKWTENIAILSGDAMSILAGQLMANTKAKQAKDMLRIFNKTAIEVCEGQMMDMEFEKRIDVSIEEYIRMIELKTSVLLAAGFQIGALAGGAKMEDAELLYEFGRNLGLAFQLQDDYLDTYGNYETFGKKIGGDILNNKKTYLAINALNLSDKIDKETLQIYMSSDHNDPQEKIEVVKTIFDKYNIPKITREKIDLYFNIAQANLTKLNLSDDKMSGMLSFFNSLKYREI
jgi:geranylgeranyl diphosphate synthase, type II